MTTIEQLQADLERTDWTPEQALQFYADQRNFDIVEGHARIIDNGAVASNALKHLSLGRLEMKGDAELTELRARIAELESEVSEQCRLNGMGSEREYVLQGKVAELEAENARLEQVCAGEKNVVLSYVEENKVLREQLAAAQAREQQLREALDSVRTNDKLLHIVPTCECGICKALSLPSDTSALEAIIKKASEVMRERIISIRHVENLSESAIRALPGVTLEDINGGNKCQS